jgi:hypothetical protein
VGSLSANLQRFGMERVVKGESLQEIIEEMGEDDRTDTNSKINLPKRTNLNTKDE